ncbi:MAG: DM13 domain-containing protein [Cyanobacteria bacterium P01_E01_bin.34]
MTSKGFGLACCLTALSSLIAGCSDLLPDSVTIPRSSTMARNSSSASEVQPESDLLVGEDLVDGDAPIGERPGIPRFTDRSTALELGGFDGAVETAGAEVEVASELAASPTATVADAALPSGIAQVAAGRFSTANPSYPTSGGMKVFEISGQAIVELADDFNTTRGPNLQLVALREAVVLEQIASSDYVQIAELLAYQGASAYPVPKTVNLDEFGSIAIWCSEFNTVYGYAPL